MSKVKEQIHTNALALAAEIKINLGSLYTFGRIHYVADGLKLEVMEETAIGNMIYDIIIRPQPYKDPGFKDD